MLKKNVQKKTTCCSLHSRRTSWSSTPRTSWSSKAICERLQQVAWHTCDIWEFPSKQVLIRVPLNLWILQTQNFQHQSQFASAFWEVPCDLQAIEAVPGWLLWGPFWVPLMILFHQFVEGAIGHRPARSGHSCHCQLQGPQGSAGWVVPKEEKRSFKTNQ